jgi:hypothetical protein
MFSSIRKWVSGDNLHGSFNKKQKQHRASVSSAELRDINARAQVKFTGDGRTRRRSAAVGMRYE